MREGQNYYEMKKMTKTTYNPFSKKLQKLQEVGGKYGINVEILSGDKTLIPGVDPIYQYLDPNDSNRIITLADGTAGDRFIIKHNGNWNDVNYLDVRQGSTDNYTPFL